MPNQKIKRTAVKMLNRKVRGVENMTWAILALIVAVVVILVLYNMISGALATANVPQVQLVPHESFVIGNTANVTLKFGRGFQGVSVLIAVPSGNTITPASTTCTTNDLGPGGSVTEGQKVRFQCTLTRSPGGVAYIVVRWTGGSQTIKWVVA
jgi:hypothetical protein